jgi:hypothetical protein
MRTRAARAIVALLALAVVAASAKSVNILVDLVPVQPKKPDPNCAIEGKTIHFRDRRVDVQVTYLDPAERLAWFRQHGGKDPFAGFILPQENYVFFRVRFENLQKEENVEFTPGSSMFGTANLVDETAIYELFYKESDGDERLAVAGKTLYFKALHLPPGQWIERLLLFKYDETYQQKKVVLLMSNILLGHEGLDLEFPFTTTFKKERH